MPDDDPFITPTDAVRSGFCARGLKEWLVTHGIDVRAFFRGEIRASEILTKGDANGAIVVENKLAGEE